MTPQRLRTRMRKIRHDAEELAEEGGELNLIPYLDIVVNVIMFLLATTVFAAALADLNVSAPTVASAAASSTPPEATPKEELNLTVSISEKGYTIAASGAVLYQGFSFDSAGNLVQTSTTVPTIPMRPDGKYDLEGLAKKMLEIKKVPTAAGETKVIINANPTIVYEHVVDALDACRGKLVEKPDPANPGKVLETYEGFGDVLLSAGVN